MDKLSVSAAAVGSGGAVEVEDLEQLCQFDMITRLADNPDFVVTVSTEREEISVWDVHDAIPVRTLTGVTHPINLKAIDDTRYMLWSNSIEFMVKHKRNADVNFILQ
jgi:hypothetical protein